MKRCQKLRSIVSPTLGTTAFAIFENEAFRNEDVPSSSIEGMYVCVYVEIYVHKYLDLHIHLYMDKCIDTNM
jgi:hypothetical protein